VEAISDGILALSNQSGKCPSNIALHGYDSVFVVSYLARVYHIVPEGQTAVSLLDRFWNGPFYYFIQVATLLILLLAANTALRTFQTLLLFGSWILSSAVIAISDRLVYSNIILLSLCAAVLVVIFRGKLTQLFPLRSGCLLHLPCPKLGWYAAGSNSGHQLAG